MNKNSVHCKCCKQKATALSKQHFCLSTAFHSRKVVGNIRKIIFEEKKHNIIKMFSKAQLKEYDGLDML